MTLLLHVLMLFLLSGGSAEVVKNFELKCDTFFAGKKPPTRFTGPPQYEQICQTLNGVVHYATYYDTHNRIPVYSAYRFEKKMGCTRLDKWHIEPQLDKTPNMAFEDNVIWGERQALNGDYVKSGYHKGHLAPVYQAQSQSCSDATFTLTNAAPQNPSFNSGQWRVLEENMAGELSEQCKKLSVFIVTGVVPGTKNVNNRVNVPSHFWTAYCCLDQNNKCQFSRGFIGVNENKIPQNITVNDLETELAKLYKVKSFEVFDSSLEPPAKKPKLSK